MKRPGERVYNKEPHQLTPGEYTHWIEDGVDHGWCGIPAGTDPEDWMCANLISHKVEEHEDGTITVTPSILITKGQGGKQWHGYLTKGVWQDD